MQFKLTSAAFTPDGDIPQRYTCEGADISPPLSWSEAPEGVQSFALIVEDPDAPNPAAPKRIWVHWVLYNIPPNASGLKENCGPKGGFADAYDGVNDWGRTGYGGPCPPTGRHRYFHRLYALNVELPDLRRPNKQALLAAMQDHVIAETALVGLYQKQK